MPDFYDKLSKSEVYTDTEFGHSSFALYWDGTGEENQFVAVQAEPKITWQRAAEINGDHTLFGSNGAVNPEDINQGWLGNCWFLAAASSLAEVPGRLEHTFLNNDNELNEAGIYGVNFYTLGVKHTVIVDDWLPLQPSGDGYRTLFAKIGKDDSLWGAILEKAFAKYQGNYTHIEAGASPVAIRTLHGGPFEIHNNVNMSESELWEMLLEHDGLNDIITAGTPGGDDSFTDDKGLVQGHAYVVLGVQQLNNGVKIVKLRNPHGSDSWKGDYSDNSS